MTITRFDPFRQLLKVQDRFNRLFDETLARSYSEDESYGVAWCPAVDISETENELLLKAELPGINPGDVDIRIENNTLTLKGERKEEKKVDKQNFHRRERVYGSFVRSFTLPTTVEQEKVTAEYKNGVLEIMLPKKEETKPKQISIKVK